MKWKDRGGFGFTNPPRSFSRFFDSPDNREYSRQYHWLKPLGWRESNSSRFGTPPFPVCLAPFFERRQPICKMALRRPKKGGGTNFLGTETGQNFCFVVAEERRYTGVFQVTKHRRAEILPVSARRGSTPVSLSRGGAYELAPNRLIFCLFCWKFHEYDSMHEIFIFKIQ